MIEIEYTERKLANSDDVLMIPRGVTPLDNSCFWAVGDMEALFGIEPEGTIISPEQFNPQILKFLGVELFMLPNNEGYRLLVRDMKRINPGGNLSVDCIIGPEAAVRYDLTHYDGKDGVTKHSFIIAKNFPVDTVEGEYVHPSRVLLRSGRHVRYFMKSDPQKTVTEEGNRYAVVTAPNMAWDQTKGVKRTQANPKQSYLDIANLFRARVIRPYMDLERIMGKR